MNDKLYYFMIVTLLVIVSSVFQWGRFVICQILSDTQMVISSYQNNHTAINCALQTSLVSGHKSYVNEELLKAYVCELENATDAIVTGSKTVELLSIVQIAT